MQTSQAKVIGFNNKSVASAVESFLAQHKTNSDRTFKDYGYRFKEFFDYTFGKDITMITWEEVESLTHTQHVIPFVNYLLSKKGDRKGNCKNTVETKIQSLKSLFDYLAADNKNIRPSIFTNIIALKNKKARESEIESYDHFTFKEMDQLIEYAKTESYKGLVKSVAIEIMYNTALRVEAVTNMEWKNIYQKYDSNSNEIVWIIRTKDKGSKKDEICISDELYNKIESLKQYYREVENHFDIKETDKVIQVSDETLRDTLKRFVKKEGIGKNRKLSIHSIKGTAGDKAKVLCGGDLLKLQEFMHHESIETTIKNYGNKKPKYTEQLSYMMGQEIDYTKLESLSKEQLLDAIKQCGDVVAMQILLKAAK